MLFRGCWYKIVRCLDSQGRQSSSEGGGPSQSQDKPLKVVREMKEHMNYTLLCDFYELTMGNGYFQTEGYADQICYFDVFFRSVPDGGGFAIAAGLEQVIDYIENLRFTEEDIAYLRGKGCFCEDFLNYLRDFRFTGDIWAVPEGTPIFPREPILTVRAPAIEAQFIETFLLLTLNHQSLIATKTNRIVRAADGRPVSEFGSRRAQGPDAAILGARASYIAGCAGTACTLADEMYGTPAGGTMAHSWVQMFPDEYTAFKTYCRLYPHSATLLVDTYNVLKSGVPNAIKAFKEVLLPQGITQCAIRLDSGDLTYLSRKARRMLDAAVRFSVASCGAALSFCCRVSACVSPSAPDTTNPYIAQSQTPELFQSARILVPSYFKPHFSMTLPEAGFFTSCLASILFAPTSPVR